MAEFASVVDSVNCAVEIQRDFAERNAELPDNRKMQFRIGVNLGDVIAEDGRLYGDGVNIAARVESLADAGDLYGGTRHSSAIALRKYRTPEEIKRATMHSTNKAFERYFYIEGEDLRDIYEDARGKGDKKDKGKTIKFPK